VIYNVSLILDIISTYFLAIDEDKIYKYIIDLHYITAIKVFHKMKGIDMNSLENEEIFADSQVDYAICLREWTVTLGDSLKQVTFPRIKFHHYEKEELAELYNDVSYF
jgi:hypothetical protein